MTRPTWITIVGVLGIIFGALGMMNAAQTAVTPQMLEWQRRFMHSIVSSMPAQDKGPKAEDLEKAFDSFWGPVPHWFKPWSIAAGLIGLGLSVVYIYGMISLMLMKRWAVRLIYACSAAAIALAVARGVAGALALKLIGLNVMMTSAISLAFHCVLLLVIFANAKETFRDAPGAVPAATP